MEIKSKENIETKENLTNHKKWFNGPKHFSSVKVQPQQSLPDLGIHVEDVMDLTEKLS